MGSSQGCTPCSGAPPGIRQEPDSRCCHVLTKHLLLHPPASLTALSLLSAALTRSPSLSCLVCFQGAKLRCPPIRGRCTWRWAGLLPRRTWALCGRGTPLPPTTMKGRHASHSPEHARKYPQVRFKDHRTLAHSL